MDNLIYNYIELLKQVEEIDVETLNDIKYMGNLKKNKTCRKLSLLKLAPKCEMTKKIQEKVIEENLDLQSKLAYWTFFKLQQTLDCKNLDLSKEPESKEEKTKLYEYFYHLILINKDKNIKNVIGVDNKLIIFDEDNKMRSDNYRWHSSLSNCGNPSFLKLVNTILENMGIDQRINIQTKELENEEGPLLFSNIGPAFYICDSKILTNLMILFQDGSIRNVKINNMGIYSELEYNSLKEKKTLSELSRTKKK